MEKRYQVFLSSTYADLKEERRIVVQTLMEMDCIPAGMELFPAVDAQQLDFIKRIIDDCDYYLLIVGNRYGSTTPDGVSYTEEEYDYAIQKGIKVLAFLHETPDELSVARSDIDPVFRERLATFREKVKTGRLVKFWKTIEELPGLVAISLQKTIKTYPAVGWVRGDSLPSADLLNDINQLRKEKDMLQSEIDRLAVPALANLAGLDELFRLSATSQYPATHPGDGAVERSWAQLFALTAPMLLDYPAEAEVKERISRSLFPKNEFFKIIDANFQTLKIQFKALGLIAIELAVREDGKRALHWSLTPRGEALMLEVGTVKHRELE